MSNEVLLQIAQNEANQQALKYVQQEQCKDKILAVEYLVYAIAMKIGYAIFDAGYGFDDLSREQRRNIARKALVDAEYRGANDYHEDAVYGRE